MATASVTLTATATPAVTLSNPTSLDELQLLGAPTININSTATVDGLVGLEMGNTVMVEVTDTATTNGTRLLAAYTTAKALPSLSASNRAAVLLPPGKYELAADLTLDTQYVDIIGLGNNPRSVIITRTSTFDIDIAATDVKISGIWFQAPLNHSTTLNKTNIVSDCIFGVANTTKGLADGLTWPNVFVRCILYNMSRTSGDVTISGELHDCFIEGSTGHVQMGDGAILRNCLSEANWEAAGAVNCEVYHCAFAASDSATAGLTTGNITNDITDNNAYGVTFSSF